MGYRYGTAPAGNEDTTAGEGDATDEARRHAQIANLSDIDFVNPDKMQVTRLNFDFAV